MDPASFVETVEAEMATELGRLGSGKLLIALTGADLAAETVLATAANRAAASRDAFEGWADDAADEAVAATARAAADAQAAAVDELAAELEAFEPTRPDDPLYDRLGALATPSERAGGLVGWALVADREHGQHVSFFVNEAAPARTDLLRSVRKSVRETRDDGVELLGEVCGSEADWEAAREAAESVVRAAYEEYADALAEMGLDPKPVC